jgi:glycosyltransferase involved in cell wall biosynthesis
MKVALVSHVLPPLWSGQAVMIGRILRNLSSDSYCLISSENYQVDKNNNSEALPAKSYVLPMEPPSLCGSNVGLLTHWARAYYRGANIAGIVKKEMCDVLVAATGDLVNIPAGWWASVLTGADFIPYLFDDYVYQWLDKETQAIARETEKRIYRRIKKVIVPNEFMRDEIQNRHNVKATIVRNPYGSLALKVDRAILPIYDLQSEIRIVYTGAIYHVNFEAFQNLIAATNRISPNIKLHLFTAQPVDWLEANGIKGGQIVFHPHAKYSEIVEAQRRAHVLFLPLSFNSPVQEVIRTSAPGKMGEYLASGVPILAHVPHDSFVSWYFRKHGCGLVVDVNDVDVLEKAVLELINNRDLRERLCRNARERAHVDFDSALASRAFIHAIEHLKIQSSISIPQDQLAEARVQLSSITAQLLNDQDQLAEARAQFSSIKAQLLNDQDQLAEARAQFSSIKAQLSNAQDQLASMNASRSWRITKPLRLIASFIRRAILR